MVAEGYDYQRALAMRKAIFDAIVTSGSKGPRGTDIVHTGEVVEALQFVLAYFSSMIVPSRERGKAMPETVKRNLTELIKVIEPMSDDEARDFLLTSVPEHVPPTSSGSPCDGLR